MRSLMFFFWPLDWQSIFFFNFLNFKYGFRTEYTWICSKLRTFSNFQVIRSYRPLKRILFLTIFRTTIVVIRSLRVNVKGQCLHNIQHRRAGRFLVLKNRFLYNYLIFSHKFLQPFSAYILVVSKASILFLIDGSSKNHFDVLQKLSYNIYKLFSLGASVGVITYGGVPDKKLAKLRLTFFVFLLFALNLYGRVINPYVW